MAFDYYFCLVPKEDLNNNGMNFTMNGINVGRTYAYNHRSSWIKLTEAEAYLGAGYVKGVDNVTHNGKAYGIMKNYIDLDEGFIVFVCSESVQGCDT